MMDLSEPVKYGNGDLVRVKASVQLSDVSPVKPPQPGDILRVVSGLSNPIMVEDQDSGLVFNIAAEHIELFME
jgi:hypothetical protein